MTKTKHAPGPWKVGKDGALDIYSAVLGRDNDDGYVSVIHDNAHAEANARLIAAAPDLLSAAKTMVSAWDNFIATEDGLDGMDSCATQVVKLRAAIAKAEGQP